MTRHEDVNLDAFHDAIPFLTDPYQTAHGLMVRCAECGEATTTPWRRCSTCDRPVQWTQPGGPLAGWWSHLGQAYGHMATEPFAAERDDRTPAPRAGQRTR